MFGRVTLSGTTGRTTTEATKAYPRSAAAAFVTKSVAAAAGPRAETRGATRPHGTRRDRGGVETVDSEDGSGAVSLHLHFAALCVRTAAAGGSAK